MLCFVEIMKYLEDSLVFGRMYIHSSQYTLILANNAQYLRSVTNFARLGVRLGVTIY
jgi:hypothetical protein